MNKTLRSIGAILAGIATGAILSIATDLFMEKVGFMYTDPFDRNPAWLIAGVILYRTVFNILGSFVTARLAPARPMLHVMILGSAGFIASVVGTIVMWHIPPHWYPITLDVLALPSAWLGGKLATRNLSTLKQVNPL